jgi:hypothetical protein
MAVSRGIIKPAFTRSLRAGVSMAAFACRAKFLRFFPDGFYDDKYLAWERDYKWNAHLQWQETLNEREYVRLLQRREYAEIVNRAIRIESRTNLLFSFEKMALRDAVKSQHGAQRFAEGLREFLSSSLPMHQKFSMWCKTVGELPRKQTRVLTWPVLTVFGMIARPRDYIFLKPNVTKRAAEKYGFDLVYESKPSCATYSSMLQFAAMIRKDLRDLRPRDMIDIQSFIWVQGSDEYAE